MFNTGVSNHIFPVVTFSTIVTLQALTSPFFLSKFGITRVHLTLGINIWSSACRQLWQMSTVLENNALTHTLILCKIIPSEHGQTYSLKYEGDSCKIKHLGLVGASHSSTTLLGSISPMFYAQLLRTWVTLSCAYVLGLYFTGVSLTAQKLRVQRWWNWALATIL
jgi:hypothetical protein